MAKHVAANIPVTTTVPRIWRPTAPEPEAMASGTQPKMKANEVMRMGRNRSLAPSSAASTTSRPLCHLVARELDDQDGVLRGKSDQHDETDLRVDVEIELAQVQAGKCTEDGDRHGEKHGKGQAPAFIERRQNQKDDEQGERKDRACRAGSFIFLIREVGPIVAHSWRAGSRARLLQAPPAPDRSCIPAQRTR